MCGGERVFHILVVEDDANARRLMETVLEQHGYQPLLARDGVEALEVLDRKHVDLIVLDIMITRDLVLRLRRCCANRAASCRF